MQKAANPSQPSLLQRGWEFFAGKSNPQAPALKAERGEVLRGQLLRMLAGVGATGVGLGIGGRMLGGAASHVQQQLRPHSAYTPDAPITIPVDIDEEKRGNFGQWLRGDNARGVLEMPLALPAIATVGTGAVMGGWHLADSIVDRLRQRQLDSELARVKNRFRKELSPVPKEKQAEQASPLSKLAAAWESQAAREKSAIDADEIAGPLGMLAGTVAVPMLATGGISAAAGYALARRRAQNSVVARARRAFENDYQRRLPPPVLAIPRVGEDDDV